MKRLFFFMTFCAAALCASAGNKYVKPESAGGSDSNSGDSWAQARATISAALSSRVVGDTVFVAEGVYDQGITVKSGVAIMGGYNAETGERDPELYETILDGTHMTTYAIVKYDNDPAEMVVIDGLVIQNVSHGQWDANAVFLRGNMTLSNCVIRNCTAIGNSSTGGVWIQTEGTNVGIVRNCLFENCVCLKDDGAGAIKVHNGGIIENCIIRGCKAGIGGVKLGSADAIMRNCVLYNNHSTYNGCIYGTGTFINNTICNNYGETGRYGGCRIDGKVVNSVFWGNQVPGGSATNQNYISSSGGSSNNIADTGSGMTTGLSADNSDPAGPNFLTPTNFVGLPTNDLEIAAMHDADFSVTLNSAPLLDQGDAAQAPARDINDVDRPKGNGVDIGAYEFDPNASTISVTGVDIVQDTIWVIVGESASLMYTVEPADASNKRVNWTIEDEDVASVKNGKVTGIKVDTTIVHVTTLDGGYTDYAVVVVKPIPPKFYPHEVLEAEATYLVGDYTVPSIIRFLVAKQEAKIDSLEGRDNPKIAEIDGRLAKMYAEIDRLEPKEMPYNQIATIYGDPATHMGFCWFTNGGIKDGVVQLIPQANATANDFETCDCVITLNAQTSDATLHYTPIQSSESPKYDICTAAGLDRHTKFDYVSHKAQATELTPGTVYSWRVGYGEYWSEIGQFVTKDENQGDFSFLYMTDSHIQDSIYLKEANMSARAVAKNEPDVKFCLFPGDFADTGGETNSEWQWEQWFEGSMRPALNKMAFVPTDGNHDDSKSRNYDYHFNTDWAFAIASSVPPQFKGITYSFVYGDVLFLVFSMQDWWREEGTDEPIMHSDYLTNDVGNWFKDQIEQHPEAKYRVTVSHKNIFSGAGHHVDDESTLLRTMMLPIFKECEIDLAIQGHDHCYEVMGPVDADTRTVVQRAISGVQTVPVNTVSNMTGKLGGTFETDDGTMYFIGATCGHKHYYPESRAQMESEYTTDQSLLYDNKHHNVPNLFDLFTSRFGQPDAPSYTRFNVTNNGIEVVTYYVDAEGNKTEFNTFTVTRKYPHGHGQGYELRDKDIHEGDKFIRNGQLFIKKNGMIYNVIGQKIAQ